MRGSRQTNKLEQWVMHRAVKNEVLGSILGSYIQKVYSSPFIVSFIDIKHSYLFNH